MGISRERIERKELAGKYAEGGKRAMAFMKKVVEYHGKISHGQYKFDDRLLEEINRLVLYYAHPDAKGHLRDINDTNTRVDGIRVVPGWELPTRFFLFGKWLSVNIDHIGSHPEDLLAALRVAAAAHYGLTGPELHPFVDGNGRTARILVNGILMSGTKELRDHGKPLPPVSNLRNYVVRREGHLDPYISALRKVRKDNATNPLEEYMAKVWVRNLAARLSLIKQEVKRPTRADLDLISKFEWRKSTLEECIRLSNQGKIPPHPIPDYFTLNPISS